MSLSTGIRRPTILVADDSPQNIELLSRVLGQDYRIKVATSGEKALQIAYSDEPPDLILLDIMMPGELDGLQVCRNIKADPVLKTIKVVLLTARGQVADRQAGKDAGADGYLIKPFSPLELIETLEGMLATA